MAFLTTFEECKPFVGVATLINDNLSYLPLSIEEALHVTNNDDYFSTIQMLNALINARYELDLLPYDKVTLYGYVIYYVQFPAIAINITLSGNCLIILVGIS